ncbi:TetR/AcrR family transcriptional regulator [Sorangium sp. So ce388]|uniref:TetR/AcrR family transcriptional regulator n=1 Tax=Sorangium sp. So ce388 TaxID=3133309 RepID=UPI003F5BACBD
MARVSQDHLDARRQQILAAARRCFVRNGFHATSMQDVLSEAELSAGGVYRYFRSKDDIIAAIADDTLAEVQNAFDAAFDAEPPPPLEEALGRVFASLERLEATQDLAKLAVQVWGEAQRSPSLSARARDTFSSVQRMLVGLVAAYQASGLVTSDIPAEHMARVLSGLLFGFLVQHALLDGIDAASLRSGLRGLMLRAGAPR